MTPEAERVIRALDPRVRISAARLRELAWIYAPDRPVYPLAAKDERKSQRHRRWSIGYLVGAELIEYVENPANFPRKFYKLTPLGEEVVEAMYVSGALLQAFCRDLPSVPTFIRNDPRWSAEAATE